MDDPDAMDDITRCILAALASGLDERSAARECNVSDRTFRRRLQHVRTQWDVGSNIEAVVRAVRSGII